MLHQFFLALFGFVYVITALAGLVMLGEGIDFYIFYKKKDSNDPYYKSKMASSKKQARTGLVLLIFGPFCLLFFILKSIIRSIPKRPASLRIFWDAIVDIFFKF